MKESIPSHSSRVELHADHSHSSKESLDARLHAAHEHGHNPEHHQDHEHGPQLDPQHGPHPEHQPGHGPAEGPDPIHDVRHEHTHDASHEPNGLRAWLSHLFRPHSDSHHTAALDPAISNERGIWATRESHQIAENVRHRLFHSLPALVELTVHVDPCECDSTVDYHPTRHHAIRPQQLAT